LPPPKSGKCGKCHYQKVACCASTSVAGFKLMGVLYFRTRQTLCFSMRWKLIKFLSSRTMWGNFIARDDNLRRNRWSSSARGASGQTAEWAAAFYLSECIWASALPLSHAPLPRARILLQIIIALVRCAALIALCVKEFESVPSRPQIERSGQFGVVRRKRMSHIFQVCRCTKSAERVATAAFICLRRLPRMQYINVDIGGVSPTELQPRA
jgi:hypothetical protein